MRSFLILRCQRFRFFNSRRSYLSLLELLVVIAILTLIGGLFAIKIDRAVQEQKFRSEVDQVVEHLRLAQNLMLIFHTNVHVKFWSVDAKGIYYQLSFDTPLPAKWNPEMQRLHQLTTVRSLYIDDLEKYKDRELDVLEEFSNKESGTLILSFLSGGSKMSQGILRLSTSDKESSQAMVRWILLPGFPSQILSVSEEPSAEWMEAKEQFNKQFTQQTFEEIRAQDK